MGVGKRGRNYDRRQKFEVKKIWKTEGFVPRAPEPGDKVDFGWDKDDVITNKETVTLPGRQTEL